MPLPSRPLEEVCSRACAAAAPAHRCPDGDQRQVGSEKAAAAAAATAPEGWDSAAVGNSLPLVLAGAAGADSKEEAVGVEAAMVEVMEVAEKVGMVGAAVEAAPLVVEG